MDPPKRERKRHINYAENEYFRNALKTGANRPAGPKPPKMPTLQDYQFYNTKRITEINEKQHQYELYMFNLKQAKKEAGEKVQLGHPQFSFSLQNCLLQLTAKAKADTIHNALLLSCCFSKTSKEALTSHAIEYSVARRMTHYFRSVAPAIQPRTMYSF